MTEYDRQKISRRGFFKKGGELVLTGAFTIATADVLSAHIGSSGVLSESFWERLETGTLLVNPDKYKGEIEEKFGVIILPGQLPEDQQSAVPLRINWDAASLWGLDSTLTILPRRFYQPVYSDNGEDPIKPSLYETRVPGDEDVSGKYSAGDHQVLLVRESFNQTTLQQLTSKKTLVHELTHGVTSSKNNSNQYGFLEIGKDFKSLIGIETHDQLRAAFKKIITPSDEQPAKLKFRRSYIGYGASNFGEFWSVAAEYYIEGQNPFLRQYDRYLGEEKAEAFYKGYRQKLFEGREYEGGNLIRQGNLS